VSNQSTKTKLELTWIEKDDRTKLERDVLWGGSVKRRYATLGLTTMTGSTADTFSRQTYLV
jgi:hypothetical protein